MIELPESITYKRQLEKAVALKKVDQVCPPSSPHKFCWFNGAPEDYDQILSGRAVRGAEAFGIFVELIFEGGPRLAFNDGVNARLLAPDAVRPKKYQMLVNFEDGWSLAFTVAMYGSIICHMGDYDNEYYFKSRDGISVISEEFDESCFLSLLENTKPNLSVKAFLATEQRIPGLGNGCLQDILFQAKTHPRQKIGCLSMEERIRLFQTIKAVMLEMAQKGGRDTEKDLYGNEGGYKTRMSKKSLVSPCPACGERIVKETYMGGAVYYCPACQNINL